MSLLSSLYALSISSVEAMLTATTVAKVSDAKDLGYANLGDGATDLYFVMNCTDKGDAAVGASFLLEFKDCATTGGTYYTVASKTLLLADVKVGEVMRVKIPAGLKRFIKSSITGAASMTGGATFKAFIATS